MLELDHLIALNANNVLAFLMNLSRGAPEKSEVKMQLGRNAPSFKGCTGARLDSRSMTRAWKGRVEYNISVHTRFDIHKKCV